MHMVKAGVMENIYAHNNHIAEHVRYYLTERNIFAVNVMGAPGTGKTTSLEQLMKYIARRSIPSEPAIWMHRSCIMRYTPWISMSRASSSSKMSEISSALPSWISVST